MVFITTIRVPAIFLANTFKYFFCIQLLFLDGGFILGSRIHIKPFLHSWSLGVEEQFYLFMPLLLLFINKQNLRQIRYLFLALAIVSLTASHYMSSKDAQSSFYLLPFRAWELRIGASIATLPVSKLPNLKFSHFPTVGFTVVLVCFFVFDENTLHPSFYTLIPILGVG